MSYPQDPPRLKDSCDDDELREALRSARADLPSAMHVAALGASLHGVLGLPTSVPPPVLGSTGATATMFGASKVVAVALAVAVVGGGAYVGVRPSRHPEAQVAQVTKPATEVVPTEIVPVLDIAPATPSLEAPVAALDPIAPLAPRAENVPNAPISPSGTAASIAPIEPAQDAPPLSSSEVTLLADAREALASAPARSLRLLDTHRRTFRGGSLAQERDVMTIEALVRLGRHEVALEQGERFLASHPGSLHAARVRALIEQSHRALDSAQPPSHVGEQQ